LYNLAKDTDEDAGSAFRVKGQELFADAITDGEKRCGAKGQTQKRRSLRGLVALPLDPATYSQPTDMSVGVAGHPGYAAFPNVGPQTLIMAQSTYNHAYDANSFVAQWELIDHKYPEFGYLPRQVFTHWWLMGYGWPRSNPVAPGADPLVTGLILGQLFDPATRYSWAQDTSEAFPRMALITSQDIRHGARPTDKSLVAEGTIVEGACFNLVRRYLETGTQPIKGLTCHTPLLSERIRAMQKWNKVHGILS
jgi:hypothetical protein